MRLEKLSYLTLWAVKFEETLRFYKHTLGLPVAEENTNFVMFKTQGSRLALHRLAKGHGLDRRSIELHFETNDVDEVYRSLQRVGVKFLDTPANKPWGTRSVSCQDPEGYTVEVVGPLKEETRLADTEQ